MYYYESRLYVQNQIETRLKSSTLLIPGHTLIPEDTFIKEYTHSLAHGHSDTQNKNPQKSQELFNTHNMTNPTIVSPVKMENGWNFSISGLKMMVKSGQEKIFLKFPHALTIFY